MTGEEMQAKRDAEVLAFITRKGGATRAEILDVLGTRCGQGRGIDTTIGRLLKGPVRLLPGARWSATVGKMVGLYVIAEAAEVESAANGRAA